MKEERWKNENLNTYCHDDTVYFWNDDLHPEILANVNS